jgi:hypothetical protein
MSPRTGVLAGAAVSGWAALLVVAAQPASAGRASVTALAAALAVPLLWAPQRVLYALVPLLVGLVCVLLAATGTSTAAAATAGVLLLVHVLLADLAADAVGASPGAVRAALGEVVPALVTGAVAVVPVALAVALSTGVAGPVGAVLRAAAPFLLALGLASRRPLWEWVPQRSGVSALTRRYLDRLASQR